jgi:hypothetical protein
VSLLVPERRIDELCTTAGLSRLNGVRIVAVSSVMFRDPNGADKANYWAAMCTARDSSRAGVPHLFMVDSTSDPIVPRMLGANGIVLPVDHDTEGGLFRPYATAARVVDRICPRALMVKVEGAKNLFANRVNADAMASTGSLYDVATGVRSPETYASMPSMLALTESILATVIHALTGTYDAASGVLAMSHAGRRIFLATTTPSWEYLITTPHAARRAGLRVGETRVDFRYDKDVVAEEEASRGQDEKRRGQLRLMLECAIQTAGGMDALNQEQYMAVTAACNALAALERRAQRGLR